MNIAQFFHKLRVIPNIEIVVPFLPEMIRIANQAPRYSLLQRLPRIGQRVPRRFAEQQVNMLRHDDVAVNLKLEAAPHALQGRLEDSSAGGGGKQPTAMVTAESDEMTLAAVVETR